MGDGCAGVHPGLGTLSPLCALAPCIAAAGSTSERFRLALEFARSWREDATAEERPGMIGLEPPPCGDQRWDAVLAALAEHAALRDGLTVPAWCLAPGRFLDRPFFPVRHRSAVTAALVHAPAAFRRRGVFLDPDCLETV